MTPHDDPSSIEVDQYFPHSPTKVWRALTSPEILAQWLMPNDFAPIVGRRFTLRARPVAQTGFSGTIACQVLALRPEKELRISWTDAEAPDAMPTTVSWTLEPEGKGTRVFLRHAGFNPDDATHQLARKFMSGGWRSHVFRGFGEALDRVH